VTADLTYLVGGCALLLAIVLPTVLERWAVSTPMVLVAVGFAIGLTPLPSGLPLDPQEQQPVIEHVTELTVIVSLMGVGLALDRPLSFLRRETWARWSSTWRLLAIAMPLTIGSVALLGWALGLAPAVALLLGAALAPTDPVLASDVQVAGPRTVSGGGDDGSEDDQAAGHEVDEADELRFALTSEAGLNDGLAFPFVYAAILIATAGGVAATGWSDLATWLGWYVLGKVALGVLLGIAVGWALAQLAFRAPRRRLRVAERGESLMALTALVTAYGITEVAGGYGFLAVFCCAMTFRSAERQHDYHAAMHEVTERLERLLTLLVMLMLGIALSRGLLEALDWRGVVVGLVLIGVLRPLSARIALAGRLPLSAGERWATAFFGVRGVGSIYYLAYASGESSQLAADWLWSTVGFTVVASVLVHGALASPVLARVGNR